MCRLHYVQCFLFCFVGVHIYTYAYLWLRRMIRVLTININRTGVMINLRLQAADQQYVSRKISSFKISHPLPSE